MHGICRCTPILCDQRDISFAIAFLFSGTVTNVARHDYVVKAKILQHSPGTAYTTFSIAILQILIKRTFLLNRLTLIFFDARKRRGPRLAYDRAKPPFYRVHARHGCLACLWHMIRWLFLIMALSHFTGPLFTKIFWLQGIVPDFHIPICDTHAILGQRFRLTHRSLFSTRVFCLISSALQSDTNSYSSAI